MFLLRVIEQFTDLLREKQFQISLKITGKGIFL